MTRHDLFRNYWWLALLVGGLVAGLAFFFGGSERAGLVGASVAGALGFCYFVQQQKLAETHLFYQLFTSFNARYDKLNGPLSEIAMLTRPVSLTERNVIVDYFNLCAEEYLFYREGYIHRDVWRSWCRGMLSYLDSQPFKEVWDDELVSDSFYGLSRDEITLGAT